MSVVAKEIPPLSNLYLYLTDTGTVRCGHCPIDPEFKNDCPGGLGWKTFRKIVEEAVDEGLKQVKILGTAPLGHPEIIEMLHGLHELKIGVGIETTGTEFSRPVVTALQEIRAVVAVSVAAGAGVGAERWRRTGALDEVGSALRLFRHAGVDFEVITSLDRRNRDGIGAMIGFAHEHGAASITIAPVSADEERLATPEIIEVHAELESAILGEERPQVFFDIPPAFKGLAELKRNKSHVCGILNLLGVLPDGSAALCGAGAEIRELRFGNLAALGVRTVWEENRVLNFLRNSLADNLTGVCSQCIFKRHCLGKCRAHAFSAHRDLLAPYPFCQEAFELGLFPESRLASRSLTLAGV